MNSYFIPILLSTSALGIRFYNEFNRDNDLGADYKPITKDKSVFNKILFLISQSTYQVHVLILASYILKTFKYNYPALILKKVSAPNVGTICVLYWVLLRQNSTYQDLISFENLYLHLFIFPIVIEDCLLDDEIKFEIKDLKYTSSFFVLAIAINQINYQIRGVWAYGLFKLTNIFCDDDYSGYGYLSLAAGMSITWHMIFCVIKN